MIKRNLLFLITVFCFVGNGLAQSFYIQRVVFPSSNANQFQSKTLTTNKQFNGLTLRLYGAGNVWTVQNRIKTAASVDEHITSDSFIQFNLITFGEPVNTIDILIEGDFDYLECIAQFVAPITISIAADRRGGCAAQVAVPQSVWRAGLNPPVPGRVKTPTEHCIVHHSAGGNGDTNYTNLVRSYYVQHTQVNGWDDIGYNYLIAANGVLFAGRDPEKAGIEQDNVMGAHLCAKNNLTMGVCLIGDFMNSIPAFPAVSTLEKLLTWKMEKDNLDPFGSFKHPDANGALLGVIAGHRDGCSTNCPGTNLYPVLNTIRNDVYQKLLLCRSDIHGLEINKITLYPNPTSDYFTIKNLPLRSVVHLFDITGKEIEVKTLGNNQFQIPTKVSDGCYFLKIISDSGTEIFKLNIE